MIRYIPKLDRRNTCNRLDYNTDPITYKFPELNGKGVLGSFYEGELSPAKQVTFRIEKVIKRKGDKIFVILIAWILGLKKILYKYKIKERFKQ